jgi:inosine/xanthosine triphosphatase
MKKVRIVVASRNPVKIAAAKTGCARVLGDGAHLEMVAVEVASGVPDQPMSDRETRQGAGQRAVAAQAAQPEADFWLGLEGGIEDDGEKMWAFAWIAARWQGGQGEARTAAFALPEAVAGLVRQGVELGEADDRVFGRRNSKQQGGAVGLLTRGRLDRAALYEPAVVLALIPYLAQVESPG